MIQVGHGETIVTEFNTSYNWNQRYISPDWQTVPFGNEYLRTTANRQIGRPEHPW